MTDAFSVVPEADAASIKSGKPAAWKAAIIEGKMISMTQRPNWTKEDVAHTGLKMRTRSYTDGAGERRFYVWAERMSGEEITAAAVGTTVPTAVVNPDSDLTPIGEDPDMPVPL